jgi:hypothetical protein|tara:strand:+ start:644 stop:862 length:219 start_codon:yes stop_codon:yes gene_type:complete
MIKGKMKNKYFSSIKIIDQISNIRKKNNKNWMDILKLAFKKDPKNASKILAKITDFDQRISKLTKKLNLINK